MQKDDGSRKIKRAKLNRTAWVESENQTLVPCAIADISDSGAQLRVTDGYQIPEKFSIRLTADGRVRRDYHIVWRKFRRVGVAFPMRQLLSSTA